MKRLTAKEEEIMSFFWEKGPLFVKQIHEYYADPKPHYNTLSTVVRGLEEKGFLSYTAYGNTYQYAASVTEEEYKRATLKNVVTKYFDNSYRMVVSTLIEEEALSIDELKALIREVETGKSEQIGHSQRRAGQSKR
ncbi:MAG: BlaI/MecI/CopY family transcriptional regulator [Bacteroidales bacterium]|jgi:predicted transcriptional regulator|nr:BlaI/MecI/CopY family transcriptional regulator [Bacteroidales bacterium]